MTNAAYDSIARLWGLLRAAAWAAGAMILLTPLIAMEFTDEVDWTTADFIFAGVMIFGTLGVFELTVRLTNDVAYRAGVAVALAAAFLVVWISGAVGIVGSEDNDLNLMFFGVLAVGMVGAFVADFRAHGMARALVATAIAQIIVSLIILAAGAMESKSLVLCGFFAVMWLLSARLFRKAAQRQTPADLIV